MKKKIIFIAGIHGVGKTTLCNYLSEELSIKNYSASNLIREYGQIEYPKNKHIVDISGNQDVLISAIEEFLDSAKISILDGHFCLLNKDGVITRIPSTTYEEMMPLAIVCLYENVDTICERLNNRDGQNHEREQLNTFQEAEITYAREVAQSLGINIYMGKSDEDRENIRDFLIDTIKGSCL